jgi:hypothetical protein
MVKQIDHWRDQKFKIPFVTNPLKNIPFYIGQKDHKEAERMVESGTNDNNVITLSG